MQSLPKPADSVGDVISRFVHGSRVNAVHTNRDLLIDAEAAYDAFVGAQATHMVIPRPFSVSAADADTVSWAYEAHFRDRDGGGRIFYSRLRASATTCPLCRIRDVAALDHYLPRDSFPAYAIQPSNLIPICDACNYAKLSEVQHQPGKLFLHPYFDDLGGDRWLKATVTGVKGQPVMYGVDAGQFADPILRSRVEAHLDFFALSRLYAKKAGIYVGGHAKMLDRMFVRGGAETVSDYLFDLSDSVDDYGAEPWIAAALSAWAADEQFCNGGWRVLRP